MADRIKGITVEIGGDTKGLKKALSGVNTEIRNTQSQLKDVERLLKMDPGNVELLEQKQRLLNKAVEDTGNKLKSLKEAEKQVQEQFKQGKVTQEQYEGLRREIIQTTKEYEDFSQKAKDNAAALQNTDRNADQAEQELESLKTATQGANRELKETQNAALTFQSGTKTIQASAKKAADKIKPLSTVAMGLIGSMVAAHESTKELRSDLSKLDTNARQNAVSVDESRKAWKNFVVVTDEADSSVEAVSNLLAAGFTESDLEIAVRGLSGAVLKFPDTLKIESLADSLQETIATGSATGQFAELLDRLGVNTEKFNKQLEKAGTEAKRQDLILQALSENGLADYYESWKNSNKELVDNKNATTDLQLALGDFSEAIEPIMTEALRVVTDLLEKFNDLNPETQKFILALIAFVAVAPTILGTIGGISQAFGGLSKTFGSGSVGMVGALLSVLLAYIFFNDEIKKLSSDIADWLNGIFLQDWSETFGPGIGDILNGFSQSLGLSVDTWEKRIQGIADFIGGVFSGDWERAWDGICGIVSSLLESTFINKAKSVLNVFIGLINAIIGGINSLATPIGDNTGPLIDKLPYFAKGGVLSKGSAIVGEAGPELLTMSGNKAVVQPLTQSATNNTTNNAFGGITINVYSSGSMEETAETIAEEIQQAVLRKGMVFA
jgi:phage-related minor tail protein